MNTLLQYTTLHCTILQYNTSCYTTLHSTPLHSTIPHSTPLYSTSLHHNTPLHTCACTARTWSWIFGSASVAATISFTISALSSLAAMCRAVFPICWKGERWREKGVRRKMYDGGRRMEREGRKVKR
jgi:hypothetical protein